MTFAVNRLLNRFVWYVLYSESINLSAFPMDLTALSLPYKTSSAVQRRKSAAKWLNSEFAADLQRLGSLFAAKVKLQRAAETLCSSLKRVAVFCSCSAARR